MTSLILCVCLFVSGLRGVGGDVLILEEAAYIDPNLFKKVIVPLIMMKYVCVFAISSPADEVNYCSRLVTMRSRATGELIWYTIELGLACAECKANPTGLQCSHLYLVLPKHRSAANLDIAQSILGADKVTAQQELFGIAQSDTSYLFANFIKPFQDRHIQQGTYHFRDDVQILHSFIDPSGAGTYSDFTIATNAYEQGQKVIVGLGAHKSSFAGQDFNGIQQMVLNHFSGLFSRQVYRNAIVMVYYECNSDKVQPQWWGQHLESHFPGKIILVRGIANQPLNPGVVTDNPMKAEWSLELMTAFATGTLWFANDEDFIHNNDRDTREFTRQEQFIEQASRYTRDLKPAPDHFGKVSYTYGAKAGGLKDDVVTAVAGSIYHHSKRILSPAYQSWCIQNNIIRM